MATLLRLAFEQVTSALFWVIVFGAILAATGFTPDEWAAKVIGDKPTIWNETWFRIVPIGIGVAIVVAAVLWRVARKPKSSMSLELKTYKRDVWLFDALLYIVTRNWNEKPDFLSEIEYVKKMFSACQDVRQRAFNGDLPIWGMQGSGGPQEKLPPEYWKYYQIEALNTMGLSDPEDLTVEATTLAALPHGGCYRALMTSRAKVDELWPPAH